MLVLVAKQYFKKYPNSTYAMSHLLRQAVKELEMGRYNTENCPEHKKDAGGLAELEHADIHIERAIHLMERLL